MLVMGAALQSTYYICMMRYSLQTYSSIVELNGNSIDANTYVVRSIYLSFTGPAIRLWSSYGSVWHQNTTEFVRVLVSNVHSHTPAKRTRVAWQLTVLNWKRTRSLSPGNNFILSLVGRQMAEFAFGHVKIYYHTPNLNLGRQYWY